MSTVACVGIPILRDVVVLEMLQLARLHMVGALHVEEKDIEVTLQVADGQLRPLFRLVPKSSIPWEAEHVQEVMRDIWDGWAVAELSARLRGLYERRLGCAKPG